MPRAFLTQFTPLDCGVPAPQSQLTDWLVGALERANPDGESIGGAIDLYRRLELSSHVKFRASVLPDYTHQNWGEMFLYRPTPDGKPWHLPTLERRGIIFANETLRLAEAAFIDDKTPPDFLIQVSCTGYGSPHASQKIVVEKGWQDRTRLLHIGHMGCYAAIPATQVARHLLTTGRVSLLHTELCSLHLKPGQYESQQVVMNTLFADGAIRYDLTSQPTAECLELIDTRETILPNTQGEMTWTIGESAFAMTLSARVPILIERELKKFLFKFIDDNGLSLSAIDRFAIHPGGPKIIDLIAGSLELRERQVAHSRRLLAARGNMSSCSIPHVWAELASDPSVEKGETIISLAFGPGLTIAANLLRKGAGC